jgi:hypothetical protein
MAAGLGNARAPRCSKSKRPGACLIVLWCAMLSAAHAQTPTPLPHFDLQLTTTRGCLETGQDPVYVVGESIKVTFRVGSSTAQQATATLFDLLPDGRVGVIAFGQIATNQTRAVVARVAVPTGVEQLQLKAAAPGVQTTRRSCSFVVVAGPAPTTTMTPPKTATSSPTPSPPPNVTTTPTPGTALSADIRTNRGCLETGDHPVFTIGESILISLRIDSTSLLQAQASIVDSLPNGFVNIFSFGFLQTNHTFQFRGLIAPPKGVESLQLRVRAFKSETAADTCSFLVVGAAPATATMTRTPTVPPAPTATRTATPTATSTPTSP